MVVIAVATTLIVAGTGERHSETPAHSDKLLVVNKRLLQWK